jgi:hypothetical protein
MRPGHLARPTRTALAALGALPFLLLVPRSASAAEPRTPLYEAPPDCPPHHEWTKQLHQRLPNAPAAADALHVRIERGAASSTPREYQGTVLSDGSEEVRTVRGTSCREVFEALVLVAVLSLDATRAEPDNGAPSSDIAHSDPLGGMDAASPGESSGSPDRMRWGAAGLVLMQSGIAPNPSLDVGAGVIARWSLAGLEPWLLLGVYTGAASQTVRVAGASARFEHAALRAVGCPWRYPGPPWVALRPCLGLDVGRSRGEGFGVSGASSNSSLWLAVRGEVRIEFSVYGGLSVGGAGGAALPIVRPRFYFEPGAAVFETPAWGLEGGGFVAWVFDGSI